MNAVQKIIVQQIMALCGTLLGEKPETPKTISEVYAQTEALVKKEVIKAGFSANVVGVEVNQTIENSEMESSIQVNYAGYYLIYAYHASFDDCIDEIEKFFKESSKNGYLKKWLESNVEKAKKHVKEEATQTEQVHESNL